MYSGPSVDEVCLLDMARDVEYMGYFKQRTSDTIIVSSGLSNGVNKEANSPTKQKSNRSLNKSNTPANEYLG